MNSLVLSPRLQRATRPPAHSRPHSWGSSSLSSSVNPGNPQSRHRGFALRLRFPGRRLTTTVAATVETDQSPLHSPMSDCPAVAILINGACGKMGRAVAEAAISAGVPLASQGITGPGLLAESLEFPRPGSAQGSVKVHVSPAEDRDAALDQALAQWPGLIVIDYTLPSAVNGNAEWYCSRGVPFVMGTTGGDRARLMQEVQASGTYAVIAAQMGKQVVAFIAAMETLARDNPGAFEGYTLKVVESHQSTKVDTSGTAKDVVAAFQKLGIDFHPDQIEKVREPSEQKSRMGVPEEYMDAHAFHTYQLLSPDGTVSFQFQHNVCGRSIYANGAVDAVLFLHKQIARKAEKTLYNMVDVLKAGSMR